MKWFRNNVRHGSRLALFALAIQFALSFGHFHGAAAQAAPAVQSGLIETGLDHAKAPAIPAAVVGAAQNPQPSAPDTDRQSSDGCAICAVVALANTALLSTPPLLLLPQAIELLYLTTDAEFAHLKAADPAFRSRAPPIS